MNTQSSMHLGQQQARTQWRTHESGAAFDRKKTPYLTERAQAFIAQQALCVIAGQRPQQELDGILVLGQPGFVEVLDESTCLLRLERSTSAACILQGLHHMHSTGHVVWLSLFFICHPTRERLCVQATIEMPSTVSSDLFYSPSSDRELVICLHIREAFFHCSKYIRTRIAGLTVPEHVDSQQREALLELLTERQEGLSQAHRRFLSQQVLCFLCTVSREGQCAVNHRGGSPGYLISFPRSKVAPGGIVLLPDYAGNGAFEAVGNILETRRATLLVPNYAAQVALCVSGEACVLEPKDLSREVASLCIGAERIVGLMVQRVAVQSGDWSATLAYECTRAASLWTNPQTESICSL